MKKMFYAMAVLLASTSMVSAVENSAPTLEVGDAVEVWKNTKHADCTLGEGADLTITEVTETTVKVLYGTSEQDDLEGQCAMMQELTMPKSVVMNWKKVQEDYAPMKESISEQISSMTEGLMKNGIFEDQATE